MVDIIIVTGTGTAICFCKLQPIVEDTQRQTIIERKHVCSVWLAKCALAGIVNESTAAPSALPQNLKINHIWRPFGPPNRLSIYPFFCRWLCRPAKGRPAKSKPPPAKSCLQNPGLQKFAGRPAKKKRYDLCSTFTVSPHFPHQFFDV